jgi:hypothetical protein
MFCPGCTERECRTSLAGGPPLEGIGLVKLSFCSNRAEREFDAAE